MTDKDLHNYADRLVTALRALRVVLAQATVAADELMSVLERRARD